MSAVQTPTTPAADAAGAPRRRSLLRRFGAGTLAATLLAGVTIAVWPASEADKARDDGQKVGQAVSDLYYAESTSDVDAALADLDAAVTDTREHAGDELAGQIDDQADALARAADGFVGSHTTDDAFEADLYQVELDIALDDLASQADDFRTQGPEVNEAFWQGVEDGLNGV